MAESRTSNVIKNSTASLMLKLVSILSQFIIRTVFIHFLGNEYTGISGLFTDILNVLSLMEMGLDVSMVYALYKPLAYGDSKKISALMSFYKKAFTVIGVIVLLAGMACIPFLHSIVKDVPNVKEDIRLIFGMYVLTSASSYFFIYKAVLLRANQKSRIISKWSAIVQLVECMIEVILLVVYKHFFTYLVIHFLASLIKNVILSNIASKMYPQYFENKGAVLDKKETFILFRDILCLTAYNLSGVVINSTDSIFISAFMGTAEVAIIGNYSLIINSVRTCVEQIVNATKPSIGNMAVTSSNEKQEEIFYKMNFISFYVSSFCCACFFTLLVPFVGDIWFDQSYKVSSLIITILTVNFYIAVMVFPVESFRTANGLFVQGWIRPVIMAIMNIILDFFMGKRWGIAGIFLATTISRLLTQVWFDSYLVYKIVFRKKPWKYYLDYLGKFLVAGMICLVTSGIISFVPFKNVYIEFLLKVIIAIIVPNVMLILFYYRDRNFQYVMSMLKTRLVRQ